MIIFHQRNRFKGISINKIKTILAKEKGIEDIYNYELDHIIPYSICADNLIENLQLLSKPDHKKKTIIDHKIIKELRQEGFIEKITHCQHELKIPVEELKEKYLNRYTE